ncbi:MAG: hypothetical protein LM591_02065 [Candidatus Korarchaeum sp.]|jgi:hypothetical protein|nr:hypothetical protein [Candidatus Korarchaeum sp.]
MKWIDREAGKILGINAFDLFLLLIILCAGGYYAYENLVPPPQEVSSFSGLNIRNAALEYSRLSGLGYLVYARVDGTWTMNGTELHDDILITWAYETRLFGWYKGSRVTIGGPNAYVEDIAATQITFKTATPSVIRIYVTQINGSTLSEISDRLEEISRNVAGRYGVGNVLIRSSLVIRVPGLKPDAFIYSQLRNKIYSRVPWGYPYFNLGDSYITVIFDYTQRNFLTTDDLRTIDSILRELNISYSGVILYDGYVFIGTEKPLTGVSVYAELLENARKYSNTIDLTKLTYTVKP